MDPTSGLESQARVIAAMDAPESDTPDYQGKVGRHAGSFRGYTRDGLEVVIERYTDIGDNISEGWQLDLLEAVVGGEPAGYLKISYIPKAQFEAYFGDGVAYAVRVTGKFLGIKELLSKPYELWDRNDLLAGIKSTNYWDEGRVDFTTKDDKELAAIWKERCARINEQEKRGYKIFHDRLCDKPVVDFVRIYEERDERRYAGGKSREYQPETSFRGLGIASVLYKAAALWMEERGMVLHASGNQTDEAGLVWKHFQEQGFVGQEGSKGKMRRIFEVTQAVGTVQRIEAEPAKENRPVPEGRGL